MLLSVLGCGTRTPPLVVGPTPYLLEGVSPTTAPHETHIVLAMNGPAQPFTSRQGQANRLVIDLPNTRLAPGWTAPDVVVHDGRVQTIKVAQHTSTQVRVVLDLESPVEHRVAVQTSPYRVLVSLQGQAAPPSQGLQANTPITIVLDPGHGGRDPGAIGPTGLAEKTAVLAIAKELRTLLRQELPQHRVLMTREDDTFVALGQRARLANKHQAQLFISIHANSSTNREANGIETWYLNFAASARAKRIAARENRMSRAQLSALEKILRDMQETDRINQASVLAQAVHTTLTAQVLAQYPNVTRRGIEGAPFVVLHRTAMPSVLVEVGFISHAAEEARLRTPAYQRTLARGILQGVRQFLQTTVVASH